jgi:hypothetical protein
VLGKQVHEGTHKNQTLARQSKGFPARMVVLKNTILDGQQP